MTVLKTMAFWKKAQATQPPLRVIKVRQEKTFLLPPDGDHVGHGMTSVTRNVFWGLTFSGPVSEPPPVESASKTRRHQQFGWLALITFLGSSWWFHFCFFYFWKANEGWLLLRNKRNLENKTVAGSNFLSPKTQLSCHKSGIARLANVEFVTLPAKREVVVSVGRFCWHSVTERNWPEPPRERWKLVVYRIRITCTFLLAKLWAFVWLWEQTNMDLPRRNIIGNCIRLALHYCYGDHHHQHRRQRLEGFRVDSGRNLKNI